MKIITNMLKTTHVDVSVMISPRSENRDMGYVYTSKAGYMSLIYDPLVSLTLVVKGSRHDALNLPVNQFYRLAAILNQMYNNLLDPKLYYPEGNVLHMDARTADKCRIAMAFHKCTVVMRPTVIIENQEAGIYRKGVEFIDGEPFGRIPAMDILSIVDMLDHLDVQSYIMLASTYEKVCAMDAEIHDMNMILHEIQNEQRRQSAALGLDARPDNELRGMGPTPNPILNNMNKLNGGLMFNPIKSPPNGGFVS